MNKFKKIALAILPTLALAVPLVVAAQYGNLPPEVPGGNAITLAEVVGLIRRVAQLLTTVGVVIGVIFIVIGGIQYMTAGGSDEKVKEARKRVINGFIGVAIVLGVGVLIQTAAALVNRSIFNQ